MYQKYLVLNVIIYLKAITNILCTKHIKSLNYLHEIEEKYKELLHQNKKYNILILRS